VGLLCGVSARRDNSKLLPLQVLGERFCQRQPAAGLVTLLGVPRYYFRIRRTAMVVENGSGRKSARESGSNLVATITRR